MEPCRYKWCANHIEGEDYADDEYCNTLCQAKDQILTLRDQVKKLTEERDRAIALLASPEHLPTCAAVIDIKDGIDHIRDCDCKPKRIRIVKSILEAVKNWRKYHGPANHDCEVPLARAAARLEELDAKP